MAKASDSSKRLIQSLHRLHELEEKAIGAEPIERVRARLRPRDRKALKALAKKIKRRVSG